MNDPGSSSLDELLYQDAGLGSPGMTWRDKDCAILQGRDYVAQFDAISSLLSRHEHADASTSAEIKAIENLPQKNHRDVDEWCDLLHWSTYKSAAHSMAAVGMLAPFFESLFVHAFQGIRTKFYPDNPIPPGHPRSGMGKADEFWDCHLVFAANGKKKKSCKKGLVLGIMELAEAVNLKTPHLPPNLSATLTPLFQYRHNMFHGGLEWPAEERKKFTAQISQENWGTLFSSAMRDALDDVPVIFYINKSFINQCMDLVEKLMKSLRLVL